MRCLRAAGAAGFRAVHAGQAKVEDDEIEFAHFHPVFGHPAVVGDLHEIARLAQGPGQAVGQQQVVFNE